MGHHSSFLASYFTCRSLHVSDRPRVDVLPPPTRAASYVIVTNTPPAHLAQVDRI
jgi:hypothetical protein